MVNTVQLGQWRLKAWYLKDPKNSDTQKNFAVLFPKPVCLKTSGQYGYPNRGQFSQYEVEIIV